MCYPREILSEEPSRARNLSGTYQLTKEGGKILCTESRATAKDEDGHCLSNGRTRWKTASQSST